jgi:hypothetical protein
MRALCFTRYGQYSDPEDLDDIINEATIRALAKIQGLDTCSTDAISRVFFWSMRYAAGPFFRKKTSRKRTLDRYLKDVEEAVKILMKK